MINQYIAHKRQSDNENQLLLTHLNQVGELASGFASKIGLEDLGMLLGLLHDFGKYSKDFQIYILSATGGIEQDDESWVDASLLKGRIDHSSAGAQYLWKRLSPRDSKGKFELVAQILALCIASHHSGLIDCFDLKSNAVFANRMDKGDELTHFSECEANADDTLLAQIDEILHSPTIINSFKTIIGVTSFKFTQPDWFNLGFLTRFLFSTLIDADRINSAEFEEPARRSDRLQRQKYFDWGVAVDRVEKFISQKLQPIYPIDHVRREISDNCLQKARRPQGIYTFTVPTGGGKTFSSLRFAVNHAREHKLDRIIYIVPYTSIIEQNAEAIRQVVEYEEDPFPWVLEQHSNLEPEQQNWRNKLVSENWDSPIVLTTMVQFLEACFAGGTRGVRRLHQLSNSVLVFDEIQSLPIKCVHLFSNALNFFSQHAGTSALLCTATQPLLDNLNRSDRGQVKLAEDKEICADVSKLFNDLNRVDVINRVKLPGWLLGEISELAIDQFEQTNRCLVIVNTKFWAKNLFEACKGLIPSDSLFHLSTNQCPSHRKAILADIRSRLSAGLPVLCISTQLIEAGVDISFASVIRFLAGLDSIAQAAGRCNRNGEVRKGQVYVVNPCEESTGMLPDIEKGKEATQRVLEEGFDNLVAPEAIARYFEYYFYMRTDDMVYPVSQARLDDSLLNLLTNNPLSAARYSNRHETERKIPLLSQAFMSAGKLFEAIEAPTKSLIVPYGRGKDIITQLCAIDPTFQAQKYYELLREAQKFSVNVFPNVWQRLIDTGAIFEVQSLKIYCLLEEFYDDCFGVSDTSGLMGALIAD